MKTHRISREEFEQHLDKLSQLEKALLWVGVLREMYGGEWSISVDHTGRYEIKTRG